MPPAARLGDQHVCPAFVIPVVKPHVGGPILSGAPSVLIGGPPAARVSDNAQCQGPVDAVAVGSPTVLICGLPAARMGDACQHGGKITKGCPTVLIGP